ncbi:hypothetical protein PHYPO_G00067560 [Pangasianodon hypophthalmus]|uniref:Cadherin-like protein 26 n=1 Tax=Pangasianodon hypophthalmus TaxID=310915 RepID=A0A5N5LVN2_PANHP|nr:hypothetical protein PHYPO_G00067560 [Pangasianodon hypophthalmus]
MRTIITMIIILFMTCVVADSAHTKIRQKRAWIIDSFTIEEECPGPFPYILGTVNLEKKFWLRYILGGSGATMNPKGVLSVNDYTGEVLVHKKVDYEEFKKLLLRLEARDKNDRVDTRLGIEIKILDINDHAPAFSNKYYETTLNESVSQGELVTTVSASDGDDPTTPNGTFRFTVASVTPKTDNVEFYISQNNNTGSVYFKGCLDYEKAKKYTVLIKATDNGDKVQLSSTSTLVLNITDQNNHLPEITGHTGPGKIKERESGVEVLRLQVTDKDRQGSPAWKAKFTLIGNQENYFKIQTDPKTNEGILTVIKAMDYEEQTSKNVSIIVENEEPYFFCKVKTRTSQGLWDVETRSTRSRTGVLILPKPYLVTIAVEDVNDPPEFVPPVRKIMIKENSLVGTLLDTLTVIDPDKTYGNSFHFVKGKDKDNWVSVDSKTGQVSVAKVMDRESPLVNHSTYSVIVYAVNKAQPPQTGTGTLVIYLADENDNVPLLVEDAVSMCLSDEKTMTNITAVDLDLPPYSAPFHYELLEDDQMQGKWKIEPNHGTTVNLVRETPVYAGHYEIKIKISDNQGYGLVQKLSITVCDCSSKPNCHVRSFISQPSLSSSVIMILAFLLLLVILLMTLTLCKKQKKTMILSDDTPGNLIMYNIEMPGTDCKVPSETAHLIQSSVKMSNGIFRQHSMLHNGSTRGSYRQNKYDMKVFSPRTTSESMSRNCAALYINDTYIKKILSKRLDQLQTLEVELCDYEPHCYANE